MCCLFGMMDYGNNFTGKQKSRMIYTLAVEAEARGTDATGIAYNSRGRLRIYKRPLPAHRMKFHIPDDTKVVLGHTRLTTQGSEKKNFNNHPFLGSVNGACFALAHNGVLRNDKTLRKSVKLPETKIETDSYIAVQLIQKKNALDFNSLKAMAEKVEGSFVFTVLDNEDTLWFIKGDNPLCIYHYPAMGLYLYASTEEILARTVKRMGAFREKPNKIVLDCGEILRIDTKGLRQKEQFDDSHLFRHWYGWPEFRYWGFRSTQTTVESGYLSELKAVASAYGYSPEQIDTMLADGFTTDELEELLYCGEI